MPTLRVFSGVLAAALLLPALVIAQSTTAPGIDVEVYNPVDGSSVFCVAPGASFTANVLVRPGPDSTSCVLACTPSPVPGGSANLATAAIDLDFDPAILTYVSAVNNPATAAVDGLLQTQNLAAGRLGWALAGDWTPDADPTGTLVDPCNMGRLTAEGLVFSVTFTGAVSGVTSLGVRQQPGFQLSFADVCGSPAFVPGAGVDEVVAASVVVSVDCAAAIFIDGFESGTTGAWSVTVP